MSKANPTREAATALAQELFAPLGRITFKRLFGGAGIYCDELFFALVHDGGIYLKVAPETEALFRAAGSEPFIYHNPKRAQPVQLSYWTLPGEALDDPDCALDWGRRALHSARAVAVAKANKAIKAAKIRTKPTNKPKK